MEKITRVEYRYSAAFLESGLVLWRTANRSTTGEDAKEASYGTAASWEAFMETRRRRIKLERACLVPGRE